MRAARLPLVLLLAPLWLLGCAGGPGAFCMKDSECRTGLRCAFANAGRGVCTYPGTARDARVRDARPRDQRLEGQRHEGGALDARPEARPTEARPPEARPSDLGAVEARPPDLRVLDLKSGG